MPYSILIVDDNARIREAVRLALSRSKEGDVCGEAENGQEAIDKVKELHPDVVILDYQMPVLDGLRAAVQIKRIAPETKIVLFTMHDSPKIMNYAGMFGVDEVVSKSDGETKLLGAVRKVARREP